MSAYHTWHLAPVVVASQQLRVASKPGALAHGSQDIPSQMLAEWVATETGPRALHLGGGTGLVSAVAAVVGGARHLWCADRSVVGAEAARRTVAANGLILGETAHVAHAHGSAAFAEPPVVDTATIRIPTDKLAMHQLLWDAWQRLAVGGRCAVAGANDEGAKSAARALEALAGSVRVVSQYGGCRLVVATKTPASDVVPPAFQSPFLDPAVMHALPVVTGHTTVSLFTRPGVFSWEHLDEATRILLDTMVVHPGESVLDVGCGAGALGLTAVAAYGARRALLLDADADAVRCTARAIAEGGLQAAEVRASDIAEAAGDERFDVVLTNPPFHVGKATALDLPRQFMADAWATLVPGGRLYLVANRTLPYERVLAEWFGTVRTVHDGRRFKVLSAIR
ncbi:MAG: methyltransferase [Gemmatimonadaceae bacterium]